MNAAIETLLRAFRRQVAATRAIRAVVLVVFVAVSLWAASLPEPQGRRVLFIVFAAAVVSWLFVTLGAVRVARQLQGGGMLQATGQLDRAEKWLREVLTHFSLSLHAKLIACQQLASLCFRRREYAETVAVCRELLRHNLGRTRGLLVATRLLLADALLTLEQVPEAYEAMLPVYDLPLSLSERMRLLPIQLRYELIAKHPASAVQGLPEKVQIAELLDPTGAALVHALLAEACRQQNMARESAFLADRARVYHDLAPLAERYPVLATIAGG